MNYEYGKPFFIIAGNTREALDWFDKTFKSGDNFNYADFHVVNNTNSLRGLTDINGIFVGNWKQRPDIKDIIIQLKNIQRNKELPKELLDLFQNSCIMAINS
jgi:hypothetical protein